MTRLHGHDCDAVIIGAGIGGLAPAIALRQIGLSVLVFERAPDGEQRVAADSVAKLKPRSCTTTLRRDQDARRPRANEVEPRTENPDPRTENPDPLSAS